MLPSPSYNTAYTLRTIALALRDIAPCRATSFICNTLSEMLCLRKTKRMDEKTLILKSLKINTVYPGHGKPFPMELFITIQAENL
ncbi:MAG: hypothetical protein ACTSRL_22890 [Candidatus Helarchaeota archaeon]